MRSIAITIIGLVLWFGCTSVCSWSMLIQQDECRSIECQEKQLSVKTETATINQIKVECLIMNSGNEKVRNFLTLVCKIILVKNVTLYTSSMQLCSEKLELSQKKKKGGESPNVILLEVNFWMKHYARIKRLNTTWHI